MIEIFRTAQGQDGAAERVAGTEMSLDAPADIFFGETTPGIAFYEKIGSDLYVTLLDGTEVQLKNFFVIGADGSYSRLLVGANRAEEITGLVAPEPIAFSTETVSDSPQPEDVAAEPQPEEQVVAEGDIDPDDASLDVVDISWSEDGSIEVTQGTGDVASSQASGGEALGLSMDQWLLVGAAGAAGTMAFGDWSSGSSGVAPAATARAAKVVDDDAEADEGADAGGNNLPASGDGENGENVLGQLADLLGDLLSDGDEGGLGEVFSEVGVDDDGGFGLLADPAAVEDSGLGGVADLNDLALLGDADLSGGWVPEG